MCTFTWKWVSTVSYRQCAFTRIWVQSATWCVHSHERGYSQPHVAYIYMNVSTISHMMCTFTWTVSHRLCTSHSVRTSPSSHTNPLVYRTLTSPSNCCEINPGAPSVLKFVLFVSLPYQGGYLYNILVPLSVFIVYTSCADRCLLKAMCAHARVKPSKV